MNGFNFWLGQCMYMQNGIIINCWLGFFFLLNLVYVIIFYNDELKYFYFDWKNEDLLDEMK